MAGVMGATMGEIILMPGVVPTDVDDARLDSTRVLRAALARDVQDLVVVGRLPDGRRYVAFGFDDSEKAVGILMEGVAFLNGGSFAQAVYGHDVDQEPV